jgi:hypothetical protein
MLMKRFWKFRRGKHWSSCNGMISLSREGTRRDWKTKFLDYFVYLCRRQIRIMTKYLKSCIIVKLCKFTEKQNERIKG